jgi:hypothetical protein
VTDATGLSEVQRYGTFLCNRGDVAQVLPEEKGDWVKYSDYAALAARLKAMEATWERHKVRERYIADIVFEHIKHGDEKHQVWLKEKLIEIFTLNGTKVQESFDVLIKQRDQLTADLAHARAEVSSLVDNLSACKYDEVAKQNQRLRAAVEKYGHHALECLGECKCGYQAALTETTETPAQRGGFAAEQQQ